MQKLLPIMATLLYIFVPNLWAGSREGELGLNLDMQFDNAAMQDFNNSLTSQGFSSLASGLGGGFGLTYGLTKHLEAGIGIDFLDVYSTTDAVFGHGPWSNYTLDLPLDEFQFKIGYVFPDVVKRVDLKANIGIAYESMTGGDSSNVPGFSGTNFNASGLGMLYSVGAEFFGFSNVSFGLDLGYRQADLSPVSLSGANTGNMISASGSNAMANFGGLFTKLSFNCYFGPPMEKPEYVIHRRLAPGVYEVVPNQENITPQSPLQQSEVVNINVPNSNGGYTPVKLTRHGQGYVGPQGEYYEGYPSIDQLKVLYGN